jgi:hypothetical protein
MRPEGVVDLSQEGGADVSSAELLELVSARQKEEGRMKDTSGPSRFGPRERYPRWVPGPPGPLPVSVGLGLSATGGHGVPAVAKTRQERLQTHCRGGLCISCCGGMDCGGRHGGYGCG